MTLPRGIVVVAGFFVLSGLLEMATALSEAPFTFLRSWEILGRGALHFLIAAGLWRRIALCRQIALVYCLAMLVTYGFALGMALAQAPVRFPPSVVWQSVFQVPSCTLLLPFLRSQRAAALFSQPLRWR
jgi:hypothetical protein